MVGTAHDDYPVLFFETQQQLAVWLDQNHASSNGVWLKFAKKASGIASVNYAQSVDVALCYGWIDGQSKSLDGTYYLQKFTPRRAKSMWSKVNIAKVEAMAAQGLMKPAGQAAIDAAKADGRWEQAYDSPSNSVVPDDLVAALDEHPKAKDFYATLNKTNTYAIIWRLQTAKKPETRANRLTKIITMLENREKLH
jgi:uncharacterized protein YdeI (YjbR/CyaY-like superfamily)